MVANYTLQWKQGALELPADFYFTLKLFLQMKEQTLE